MIPRLSSLPLLRLVALLPMLLAAGPASAQDRVNVRAWFVEATDAQMSAALSAPGKGDGDSALVAPGRVDEIVAALEKNGATFLARPRALTNSGHRITIESVRELRYPTNYKPAPNDPAKFLPTEFETRNVGQSLGVELVVEPERRDITITLDAGVTDFLGFTDAGAAASSGEPGGATLERLVQTPPREGAPWQPLFAVWRVASTITLPSGGAAILGGMREGRPGTESSDAGTRPIRFLLITASLVNAQ